MDLIFESILRLNQEGITILLVEQNAKKALKVSHRGYVLQTGAITLTGTGARAAAQRHRARGIPGLNAAMYIENRRLPDDVAIAFGISVAAFCAPLPRPASRLRGDPAVPATSARNSSRASNSRGNQCAAQAEQAVDHAGDVEVLALERVVGGSARNNREAVGGRAAPKTPVR